MLLLLQAGCLLGVYPQEPCTENAECRDAFGIGWTCDAELGMCGELEPNRRCSSWPDDLFLRPDDYRDHILLGSLFDHSADVAEVQAARLPVMQVVDQGGLLDRDFALVECSYETNSALDGLDYPEAARDIALYLTEDLGVQALIGPATSSQSQEVFNATEALGPFIISPSATSPALTTIDGLAKSDLAPGTFWRTAPPDSLQGIAVAEDMKARGRTHVAVIYQSGPYGEGLAEVFLENFVGGARVADTWLFGDDTARNDAVADVGALKAVQEVFFISSEVTDIVSFLNSAASGGYALKGIFLADGAADTQLLEATGSAAGLYDQVRGTRPSVPTGLVYDAFRAAYAGEFTGQDASASVYTAYSFDASWLAIYGVAWSLLVEDELTGLGISRGLRKVSEGQEIDIRATSWNEVKARFSANQGIDVVGASGELDYDPATGETTAPIEVWRIDRTGSDFELCYTFCWKGTDPWVCDVDVCSEEK